MLTAQRLTTIPRRRALWAAAVAAVALAGASAAVAAPDLADLTVVDRDTGRPLTVWRHHGRLFVAGEPGRRYSLRLTNHSAGRVEVVVSVDGVNIVNGETANVRQTGYLLFPYQTYDVTGWRKSTTEVAAFAFAPLPQSYAARTGRPGEVGVIGVAVYAEKPAPRPVIQRAPPDDEDQADDSAMAGHALLRSGPPAAPPPPPSVVATGGQPAPRPEEKLGTAHGAREWSPVQMVDFERATPYPVSVRQVEYDAWDNLVASGVIPARPEPRHRPRPFPADPDGAGFVPDPPRGEP